MVSAKSKLCHAESPLIQLQIPILEQTEKQRAIKKECRKIGRQGEAGKTTNRLRIAKKRAQMTDGEKAATNERRKAAAAASYLRNRKTVLRKAQDKWIATFIEKVRHPDADLWYPYHRNTYRVGEQAGVSTNPRIYL
ncbi:MAG: hypothetical protein NXY57DRAFT_1044999 [Lentinula lateritia]|nr:MAG: hypothetical protein NXY57DRAFT_1044999 [Lentinula lateritia]